MQTITSVKNPRIRSMKALSRRQERESAGLILVEGEVMIQEALKCGLMLKDVLCVERKAAFAAALPGEAILVPDEVMQAVCDTRTPQGVCAAFQAPAPYLAKDLPSPVVALDGVQDPGNVGTIWRTADAAGFGGVLLGAGCADPLSPKVLRSAMGSAFRVPFARTESMPEALGQLRAAGYSILCSDLHGEDFYSRRPVGPRFVLVIGSEAHGISQATRALATHLVKLPMRGGAESLNAAVAAGIMMYELMR